MLQLLTGLLEDEHRKLPTAVSRRRGRRAFVAGAAACLVVLSAIASAAPPREFVTLTPIADADPASDDRGLATSNINSVSYKQGSLVSAGGYQFTSYYGADGRLIVARRDRVSRPELWDLARTRFTAYNVEDRHNSSSLAIDGDGYLHIAWGMHGGGPLLYTRSSAPVLNDEPLQLHGTEVGNEGALQRQIPLQNDTHAITYPQFWNVPASGDLLLTFRVGTSGNGEWQLVRWENAARAWRSVHTAIGSNDASSAQPWIDNDYEGDDRPNTNAYHNGLLFDAAGRIHVSWTWRTGGDSPSKFSDYQSCHNILYASSHDHGLSWYRSDGHRYKRNGRHDIDEDNATPVVVLREGSSMMNQTGAALGPNGHYYVANYWAPRAAEGNHLRQYMLAEYNGTTWQVHQISDRRAENDNARIPESNLRTYRMSRPIVLVDEANRVLLVFCDYQRGGVVTVACSEREDRSDWRVFDLTAQNMGLWEPTFDRDRWQADGVLSMYYQPCGLGEKATAAAVLEWDARGYFASP